MSICDLSADMTFAMTVLDLDHFFKIANCRLLDWRQDCVVSTVQLHRASILLELFLADNLFANCIEEIQNRLGICKG